MTEILIIIGSVVLTALIFGVPKKKSKPGRKSSHPYKGINYGTLTEYD